MDKSDHARRWAAGHIAQREARRRALEVAKMSVVIVVTVVATLVLTGHRLAPECVRTVVCFEPIDRNR